jgi:hypothetical protein
VKGVMTNKPSTFAELLDNWPTPKALSADLDVPYINAQQMKRRRSVDVAHWPRLIDLLAAKGIALTNDDLVAMAIKRREVAREGQAA